PAAHDLVARVERRLAEHVETAVRARADRDLLELDAVARRERLVEAVDAAVRIAVELARRLSHRVERGREGRERPPVRGELHDPLEAELPLHVLDRLAGLVRRQLLDRGAEETCGHARTLQAYPSDMARIGLFPLELVLAPTERVPLHVFEPRYKELIGECLEHDEEFGIVLTKPTGDVHHVGTRAPIVEGPPVL